MGPYRGPAWDWSKELLLVQRTSTPGMHAQLGVRYLTYFLSEGLKALASSQDILPVQPMSSWPCRLSLPSKITSW